MWLVCRAFGVARAIRPCLKQVSGLEAIELAEARAQAARSRVAARAATLIKRVAACPPAARREAAVACDPALVTVLLAPIGAARVISG